MSLRDMATFDLLDDVVEDLSQNQNLLRIKKLILFTCHDFLVDDLNELQDLELRPLIQELMEVIPNLQVLKTSLNGHVKKLTKQSEYFLIADVIIDTIGQLYPIESGDRVTTPQLQTQEESQITAPTIPESQITAPTAPELSGVSQVKAEQLVPHSGKLACIPKPFELRLTIANNVSPLRAKVLLFSALYQRLSLYDRDWAILNTYDLDSLLDTLFRACNTLQEVETKLQTTAGSLESPDENRQVAGLIVSAMRHLYV